MKGLRIDKINRRNRSLCILAMSLGMLMRSGVSVGQDASSADLKPSLEQDAPSADTKLSLEQDAPSADSKLSLEQDAPLADSKPSLEQDAPSADSKIHSETVEEREETDSGVEAVKTTESQPERVRRPRREIQNREFEDCEKIALLLNAHCDMPTLEDLNSTSPKAERCLLEILDDEGALFSVRLRALESLSLYGTQADEALRRNLEALLDHPDEVKPLALMQAIRAYSKIDPENAPDKLSSFFEYDNDMIRFVTISSLCGNASPKALSALQTWYQKEKNAFFKRRLEQAIQGHGIQGLYCN